MIPSVAAAFSVMMVSGVGNSGRFPFSSIFVTEWNGDANAFPRFLAVLLFEDEDEDEERGLGR